MQDFLGGNLIVPVRCTRNMIKRKPTPLFTEAKSIDDSTEASTSPIDPMMFGDRKSSFSMFSNIGEMKMFARKGDLQITNLFPLAQKGLKAQINQQRIYYCKSRKKAREEKIKKQNKDKASIDKKKKKNPGLKLESLMTYKLFRISVLQNNRFFRKSRSSIVMPVLNQFQRKKIFKKNETAQKILDGIKLDLQLE